MAYEVEFGQVLKQLRLEKNLSQAELSELSGVHRTFISLMERGIRQPTLTTIIHLSRSLQLRPGDLVTMVDNRTRRLRWKTIKR